jgi:hypothetical protein
MLSGAVKPTVLSLNLLSVIKLSVDMLIVVTPLNVSFFSLILI